MTFQTSHINRRTALRAAGAAAVAGIAQPLLLHDARAQSAVPVKLTTGLKLANYGPIYVAQRAGFFEQQGLSLSADVAGSVTEPVAITLSGRGQFAATGTGMAMNATAEGGRMKVIAKMTGALGMWVIAKPGTTFNSLADFKGKKVASLRFPSNTVTSPTFAMKKFGSFDAKASGVEFVEGPPGSIVGAVRDGRADVGVVFEWDASIAAQSGLQVVYGFAETVGPILLTSVMVKEDYLTTNADTVQRFCNALAAAMKLIHSDKAAYLSAMTAEFSNLDKAVVATGCDRLLATRGFVPLSPVINKSEWDAITEHDTLAGTVRKAFSFEEMVDNRFAQKAADTLGLRG
ncbi:MAG: ABC transporter substrate-binding protein [Beijerinckiaceae bacterium]